MCKEHEIAKDVIRKRINDKKDFTYPEIAYNIVRKGGIMRVSIGVTVNEYLKFLEARGVVRYTAKEDKFIVLGYSK
jgi:hypothetical protein